MIKYGPQSGRRPKAVALFWSGRRPEKVFIHDHSLEFQGITETIQLVHCYCLSSFCIRRRKCPTLYSSFYFCHVSISLNSEKWSSVRLQESNCLRSCFQIQNTTVSAPKSNVNPTVKVFDVSGSIRQAGIAPAPCSSNVFDMVLGK